MKIKQTINQFLGISPIPEVPEMSTNELKVLGFIKKNEETFKSDIVYATKISSYDVTKILSSLIQKNKIKVINEYFFTAIKEKKTSK